MPPFQQTRHEGHRNFYLICDSLIGLPFTCLTKGTTPSLRLRELRQQLNDITAGARPSFQPSTPVSHGCSPIMELVALQTPGTILEMVRSRMRVERVTFWRERRVIVG